VALVQQVRLLKQVSNLILCFSCMLSLMLVRLLVYRISAHMLIALALMEVLLPIPLMSQHAGGGSEPSTPFHPTAK
jgi:hypothetical protein